MENTRLLELTELELSVILKALKIRKFYFEDNTATEEQIKIENYLIDNLQNSGIKSYPGI